jgi:hypothetical protein
MRFLGLLYLGSLVACGQTLLEGVVVDAISGARLAGVNVFVDTLKGPRPTTQTDTSGRFRLIVPPMQSYSLQTGYPGYLPNPKQLQLTDSGGITHLRIELYPAAVISGRIDDDDGFPVESALVHLLGHRMSAGQRKLESVKYTQTDDLGRFRFANLRPGRYWIAMPSSSIFSWDSRYVAAYYPTAYRLEDAIAIELKPGEEFRANMHLKKQEGVTVSGRLEPIDSTLDFHAEGPQLYSTFPVIRHPDGSFLVRHVPPGSYVLHAERRDYRTPSHSLMARVLLTVGRENVSGIILQARQTQTMTLSYRLVGIGHDSELLELTLRPRTDIGIPSPSAGLPEGILSITGPLSEHYYIDVHQRFLQHGPGSEGIPHPVSAQLGGREVLQTGFDLDEATSGPLVITLDSRSMEVRGKLLDATGNPVAGDLVALISPKGVPESAATTGEDGSFRAAVWRPGEYRIVVITDEEEWNDPDFLLRRAGEFPPLRVVEGVNPQLNLRLSR